MKWAFGQSEELAEAPAEAAEAAAADVLDPPHAREDTLPIQLLDPPTLCLRCRGRGCHWCDFAGVSGEITSRLRVPDSLTVICGEIDAWYLIQSALIPPLFHVAAEAAPAAPEIQAPLPICGGQAVNSDDEPEDVTAADRAWLRSVDHPEGRAWLRKQKRRIDWLAGIMNEEEPLRNLRPRRSSSGSDDDDPGSPMKIPQSPSIERRHALTRFGCATSGFVNRAVAQGLIQRHTLQRRAVAHAQQKEMMRN